MANTSILGLTKPAYTDDADISDLNGNFDLIDAEAGRLRANFAPTYSTSSAYAVGDYVVYTGNLYRCTTAIGSGGESWTAGHWTQVAIGTEVKGLSDQIVALNSNKEAKFTSESKQVTVSTSTFGQYYYADYVPTYDVGKIRSIVITQSAQNKFASVITILNSNTIRVFSELSGGTVTINIYREP